ncbi:hypothetical protein GQ457_17G007670 [Hibiscus cannabinus]
MSTGSREQGAEQKKGSFSLNFSSFSFMGNSTDRWFPAFFCFGEDSGSQQRESRSRPPLGRRLERLGKPSPGDRNLNRYRQAWNETSGVEDLTSWMALSERYKGNSSDGSAFLRRESDLVKGGNLRGTLESREPKVTFRLGGKFSELDLPKESYRIIWKFAKWKLRGRMAGIDDRETVKEESKVNGVFREGFISRKWDLRWPEMEERKPRKNRGKFSGKKTITWEERGKIDSRVGDELYEGTWKGCRWQGHILGKGGTFSGYVIQSRQLGCNEIETRGAHKNRLETFNHAGMMALVISVACLIIATSCREAKWVLTNGDQALPAYAMQAFLLPECILDPIVSTMRRFWWSGKARERGWAHVAWGKLCRPKAEGGLGFRNLKQFNIALLGKQVWKLYTCRDSLCFKVLSAKYFTDGNIMNAGPKDKCSFVWRSILKAKEELKAGFHWRIGVDSEVAMFQQKWGGDIPITLEGNHLDNYSNPVKCKEFMVPGLARWDERKVQQVFSSNDAQKILSCPIANSREDILRWSHHQSGLYVTKTAHHWLEKQGQESHDVSPVWKTLAKANVLPKVRIFGWRVAQEALPVGKKLQAACVGPGLCQMCGKDMETVLHALRECPSTQEVLQVSGLERLLPQGPFNTGLQWLEEATQVLDTQQFTFLMVLIWNIWNRRNRWVHQNQLIPPKLVADFAQMLIGEAWDLHNSLPTPMQDSTANNYGVVARDHNGLLIDARARRLEGSYTPEIVEACAMAEGIRMAIENGWQNVIFEGDSTGIVSKLHADCLDRSVASTHLAEAWNTLKNRADFAIRHVGRVCNQAAHQLAHWGLSCIDPFVFSWDTPHCIMDIVINDAIYG